MDALSAVQFRLLLAEASPDIGDILSLVLTEEGYTVLSAGSLDRALALAEKQTFQLILADFFTGKPDVSLAQAQKLRRHAHPTPVALLSTQNLRPEEVEQQGFVFLLRMPFDLEELLARVAAAIQHPLSPLQQRQAEILERFLEAINVGDIEAVVALSTDDVAYYPPAFAGFENSRKFSGKAAFYECLQEFLRAYREFYVEDMVIYARPKGLAVRYTYRWRASDGTLQRYAGNMLLHFRGEAIAQIGLQTNLHLQHAPRLAPSTRAS